MDNFLDFLSEHTNGILVLLLLVFATIGAINWLARIFKWGRYKSYAPQDISDGNLGYVITQFFVNLINDFKHLLALVIVVIFAGLIIYSMTTTDDFEQKMEALQLVIASLGGIFGTVIGYYFGESAARERSSIAANSGAMQAGQMMGEIEGEEDPIVPAPRLNR